MTTGWINQNDKWFYYDENGNLVRNNWNQSKGNWYYLDETGQMVNGSWKEINLSWYYFYPTGIMAAACWIQDNDRWYYVDTNGAMQTGWIQLNNVWYYLIESSNPSQGEYKGVMISNCTRIINGKEYTFNEDGSLKNNFCSGTVSEDLVNFVKSYEGFSAKAYYDGTGYTDAQLTIGYGTTKASVPEAFPNGINSTCTEAEACEWLKQEIDKMAWTIKCKLTTYNIDLNQNQFDALCSFSYNCGTNALFSSTLWKNIISGCRDSTLKTNFQAWSKAGGATLKGLYNRRTEEYEIFANANYTRNL